MAVYGPWLATVFTGYLTGKSIKAMLVTSAFAQNVDHDFRNDITAEASGPGYTAGGVAVTGFAASYDATNDRLVIDCDTVDFGNVELSDVSGVVFYISTGSAATDPLIAVDTFPPVEVVDTASFAYAPHANGLILATIGGA